MSVKTMIAAGVAGGLIPSAFTALRSGAEDTNFVLKGAIDFSVATLQINQVALWDTFWHDVVACVADVLVAMEQDKTIIDGERITEGMTKHILDMIICALEADGKEPYSV